MTFEELQQSISKQLTEYANENGVMVCDITVEWHWTVDGAYYVMGINTSTSARS